MNRLLLAAVLALVAGANVKAETTTWNLDKAHSQVRFSVAHLVISSVDGRFTDFDVTLENTKEDFTDATITASLKTKSINTDNEKRDAHLQKDDFLNAEKYPELKFASTRIEKTGDGTYKIYGNLTIRDVTKPVVLDTKYLGTMKGPRGLTRTAFKASTSIDRFDYGVNWNAATETGGLVAGKTIDISLTLEFTKAQPEAKDQKKK